MALCEIPYQSGDCVFAKLRGYAPWPSIVREVKGNKVMVDFICVEKTW